ncbi:MAG TPA: phage baseplate assembly protein [Acetobacteraceae bacterium]|jgi:phage gp45-like
MLESLAAKTRMMISRGALTLSNYTACRPLIQATGMAGETLQNVELLFPYGFSALPKAGAVILLDNLGTRTHVLAIMADDATLRITDLAAGEFGHRDGNAQQIVFRADRIEITTPLKLVANVTGDCDLTVGGDVNIAATGTVNIDGGQINLGGTGGKLVLLDGDGGITSSATKTFAT